MNISPWLPFEWVVASKFLKEGAIQTTFSISGISIGVAVIVFMSALLTGMQENFVNRVLTGQPHIQLLVHKEVVRPLYSERGVIECGTRGGTHPRSKLGVASHIWLSLVGPW